VQRPHQAAAQIEIKVQVELAGRCLVSPHRSGRLLGSLRRGPLQAGCPRLVKSDQLFCLRGRGNRRGRTGSRGFRRDHRKSLIAGFGGWALGPRAFGCRRRGGFACRARYRADGRFGCR
jgi:hypothetical protein